MKKITFLLLLIVSCSISNQANAQLRVGLNINIGSQPLWGPTGYDHVEYYYMPDIDVYYNVPNRQYFYFNNGRWMSSYRLPSRYHYDLYSGYKVVINEPYPYRNASVYRDRYASYKGNNQQQLIRNSRDNRYFENKNHPQHNEWKRENNRRGDDGNRRKKD